MTEHTPGPWKFDGDDLWHFGESYRSEHDPHTYIGVTKDKRLRGSALLEANARLIAAAPDLLEAAHAVDLVYAELSAALPKLAEESPDGWRAVMDAVGTARAAIAKATGES